MKTGTRFALTAFILFMSAVLFAQSQSADLAINHNRLIREKTGDGVYKLIGTYKVIGTSYLFGEKNKGNLFSTEAKAYNIFLSYNAYNQEVEFYSTSNPDKPLIKKSGEVDSFFIQPNVELGIINPLKFVYGAHLGSNEKMYYQEVYGGSRFSIYKKYKADLDYVSSNYIQSELRQFDLSCEYYYVDAEKKTIKKIKPNSASVVKEFKDIKDMSGVVTNDAFTVSPDDAFRKAFTYLNNQ
jgi:hypothetical protein